MDEAVGAALPGPPAQGVVALAAAQRPASGPEDHAEHGLLAHPGYPHLPPGIKVHPEVETGADDPARMDTGRRLCVAAKNDGGRCHATAPQGYLTCNAHGRRLDSSKGGHALAKKRRDARSRAEEEAARRALGTRALVAAKFAKEAAKVELALGHLIDAAASGDIKSAQALLPWLDQGLGRPTERVEQLAPSSPADLAALTDQELDALVASSRAAQRGSGQEEETRVVHAIHRAR